MRATTTRSRSVGPDASTRMATSTSSRCSGSRTRSTRRRRVGSLTMGGFLLRKAGAALVVLLLASMLVFLGVRAIPGDPAIALGGESRDPALLTAIRHKYMLDRPLPVQYGHWLWLAVHGDLGMDQRELSVSNTIVTRLPITLELAFL